ncbi:MAG: hypothetical protein IJ374_04460 [Lachnospiraceae bacterium]|nr:hypothetical protein [Lachnospiraceae bacterium]
MDKYEFNIKVEQIKKLVNRGDYATAMKIADTIDWHRVRNASLLSMIAQIYEKNEEYQEAKDILLIAFERAPIGKRLLYKLTELALKEGSVDEATAYYKEFCELAQDDPRQYLLRYMILKEKNAPIEQLIRALEVYTSTEVDEKWMYELAELYHKAGLEDKCVSTCDTIMLLFGLGKYVDKAMDLKLEYAPLNKYQMDLVENRDKYEAKLRAVEEEYGSKSSRRKVEEVPAEAVPEQEEADESVVIRLHEEAQTEMLAQEMAKLAEEEMPTASVEEDDMEATRALDDLHSLKEIKPTQRVLDAAAEREAAEAEREIERQRAAIRAAKEREEMEEAALRRAEAEREAARREEEERRAKRQAEIDRERANAQLRVVVSEEADELEMETLDEEPEMYNLMIEAETEEEGLAMAIEALKKIHKELGSKNPVAKISSEKLNKRGISAVADKLAGKDLVIEHAAGLTDAVQNELDELMEKDESGMIVVLIDTPANLEALHARHASLASKFQYIGADHAEEEAVEEAIMKETESQEKIAKEVVRTKPEPVAVVAPVKEEPEEEEDEDVREESEEEAYEEEDEVEEEAESEPEEETEEEAYEEYDDEEEMDPDEFAQFACKYASDIDCSIVDKSLLALYERIEMMEEDGVRLTKKAAVDLIEEAADKAEKQSIGRKIMSLISPIYDKDGYLILREKDFFD